MTGGSTQKVRVAIMYFAPNYIIAPIGIWLGREIPFADVAFMNVSAFARRDTGLHCARWIEKSLMQAQRGEYLTLGKLIEGIPGQTLQQKAEDNEAQIAVNNCSPRRLFQRYAGNR